jgi:hypothetical protein
MNEEQLLLLGQKLLRYAHKFNVPLDYIMEILEDQKVVPMIRGKAMEYNAYLKLEALLPRSAWSVQKLNLNAQTGTHDEDISLTHRRTGMILKVESKSGCRGSISTGTRSRLVREAHFKVKCHRSRSNIELAGTSNDRYSADSFDVIITNPSNAIIQGNTVGENFELVHNLAAIEALKTHYGVTSDIQLISAAENDWRFCIPTDIAIDGFIPRTPYVKLSNDPNWRPLSELETRLLQVVQSRRENFNDHSARRA